MPKSVLVETFGDSPTVRVMDFFLTYTSFDYTKTQVAREVSISRLTIEPIWARLIKDAFLTRSRQIGRAELCRLNKANPKVRALLDFDIKLSLLVAKKAQKVAVPVRGPRR